MRARVARAQNKRNLKKKDPTEVLEERWEGRPEEVGACPYLFLLSADAASESARVANHMRTRTEVPAKVNSRN
jgi:hypothetical protein